MAGVIGGIVQGKSSGADPTKLYYTGSYEETARTAPEALLWFQTREPGMLDYKPKKHPGRAVPAVLVNPETFSERVGISYAKDNVLGLSHQVIQYTYTESRTIPLELYFSLHIMIQRGYGNKLESLLDWRDFFSSLTVPTALGLAPPSVKVVWPGVKLKFEGVVENLEIAYESFTPEGKAMAYTISMDFLATPNKFRTSGSFTRKDNR
jgi:hypothetical protein